MLRMITRATVVSALGLGMALGAAAGAFADPGAQAPTAQELKSAGEAASAPAVRDALGKFFVKTGKAGAAAAAQSVEASVSAETVPVYELSRDFVVGTKGASVGQLAYVAVPAVAPDGSTASVWTIRTNTGGWEVGNIASGDRERQMASKLPAGATLLHEPQQDAWYAVQGDSVRRIDGNGAGQVQSLAAYQKAVAGRYGDKLAGSDYAKQGQAGGFSETTSAAASPSRGVGTVIGFALIGGMVLLGVGAAFVPRSRS